MRKKQSHNKPTMQTTTTTVKHKSMGDLNHSTLSTADSNDYEDSIYTTSSVDSTMAGGSLTAQLDLFDEMIIHPNGHSVLQLSQNHRILLVFIKWYGCPYW